jgi:hypothetical protein
VRSGISGRDEEKMKAENSNLESQRNENEETNLKWRRENRRIMSIMAKKYRKCERKK